MNQLVIVHSPKGFNLEFRGGHKGEIFVNELGYRRKSDTGRYSYIGIDENVKTPPRKHWEEFACSTLPELIGVTGDTVRKAENQELVLDIEVVNDRLLLHGPMTQVAFDAEVAEEVQKQVAVAREEFERKLVRRAVAVKPKRKYVKRAPKVAVEAPVVAPVTPATVEDEYEDDTITLTEV